MRTHKQPFWQSENVDFGNTIETIPLIGELLLEEVQFLKSFIFYFLVFSCKI
jgi:hypothetical protein